MILASNPIIGAFRWMLEGINSLTDNFGWTLIIFGVLVKLILAYPTAKAKKSSMKMSRMAPKVQAIKDKYPNDPQKQNELTQALYKEEGVSMGGGCLWSLLPLLILIPLYNLIREYITGDLKGTMNMMFLGSINLGQIPQWKIWNSTLWAWDWAHIGAALIPLLSVGIQFLNMFISRKMNNALITDEKGLQDKETAKNAQQNQQMNMMMWMMPLMSLWIGFTLPTALGLYWLVQGLVSMILDVILTQHYRKVYDAEDAAKLQRALEQEAIEAEKERLRAERRAANPDGITQNTSKKKLQQQQKAEQEAAKAAAKKEYDAKKGIVTEETAEPLPMSGVSDRPFCKGRAYDPNRYARDNTEE